MLQLIGKARFPGNPKSPFQSRRHRILMLLPVLPKVRAAGVFSAASIRHIKYISQLGIVTGGVDQSDSPGAAPHIPAHSIIPQVIFRAGRCLRALGKDHQLLVVGVLIQPRSGGQKGRPLLVAAGDLLRRVVRHLRVELQFSRHPCLLVKVREQIQRLKSLVGHLFQLGNGAVRQGKQFRFTGIQIAPHFFQGPDGAGTGAVGVEAHEGEFIKGPMFHRQYSISVCWRPDCCARSAC